MVFTSAAEVTGRPQRKSAEKGRLIFANLFANDEDALYSDAENGEGALHLLEEADLDEKLEGGELQTDVSDDKEQNKDAEVNPNQ